MKWVTWENVGVDRIGCAWLILREIDPQAQFLFVTRGGSLPHDAEPFDVPAVRFSHHDGHCSFHAIVMHHNLTDPILHRIARIIDEADTMQAVTVEPAAAGLDLICEGLRLISPNDQPALERGRVVYDAMNGTIGIHNVTARSCAMMIHLDGERSCYSNDDHIRSVLARWETELDHRSSPRSLKTTLIWLSRSASTDAANDLTTSQGGVIRLMPIHAHVLARPANAAIQFGETHGS